MRKMAYIVEIDSVSPIEGADAIEVAVVNGWKVVVKKGEYTVGDMAVYCEIDSWIPHELAPFLSKGKAPREFAGIKGERLRTIKLRGQISQGLLLSMNVLNEEFDGNGAIGDWKVEDDVSEKLGIQKYEPPIPAQLRGKIKGNFPVFLRKTDQERVQNCFKYFKDEPEVWVECVVEEKLEGSSFTAYYNNGQTGVCSRNLDLVEEEGNAFWDAAREQNILEALTMYCERTSRNFAIQGELIGVGVQGNIYNLPNKVVRVFDIFDIDEQEYVNADQRWEILEYLNMYGAKLDAAPYLQTVDVSKLSLDDILVMAEGKSVLNKKQEREGIVFKSVRDPSKTFKAISNRYLLKEK